MQAYTVLRIYSVAGCNHIMHGRCCAISNKATDGQEL